MSDQTAVTGERRGDLGRLTRRSLLRRALTAQLAVPAFSVLLSACSSTGEQGSASPTRAPSPATSTTPASGSAATPSPMATPTLPSTRAAVGEILFGAVHPLSGSLALDGAFVKNGIDLAVEEINAAGGIKALGGAKLRVEHADSQGKPEVGQAEAERLVGKGVVALLGAYQSAVTFNTTQVAERARVPHIVVVAAADDILKRGFKYSFRHNPNQTQGTLGMLEAIKELRSLTGSSIATAVHVHEDSLFGTGFAKLLASLAPNYSLKVIEQIPYSLQGLTDLTTELTRVQALNPDLCVVTGYLNDGILLARTARDLRLRAPLFGLASGAFSTKQFVDQLGATAEGILDANYHYDAKNPKAREVRDRYKAKYGADMPTHAVMAYEAVRILADALERAASTDRDAIRDALAKTSFGDHILPYKGPIEFDETGQAKNARFIVMQIQNGQILQVLPTDFAEARIKWPPA
jgi:branched-chain amino acid transport system substrate-binding protein